MSTITILQASIPSTADEKMSWYTGQLRRKHEALLKDGLVKEDEDTLVRLANDYMTSIDGLIQSDPSCPHVAESQLLHDVWHGENEAGMKVGDSQHIVLDFFEGKEEAAKRRLIEVGKTQQQAERTVVKLRNILAANKQRPDAAVELTMERIKAVHATLMKDLLPNAGEFRKERSKPAQSILEYALPEKIEGLLSDLLTFVTQRAAELDRSVWNRNWILLMTLFFREFLLIHPFSNGNERLARLLVCSFMPHRHVPVSFDGRRRGEYLDALEDAAALKPPFSLATFLLRQIVRSLDNLVWLLSP